MPGEKGVIAVKLEQQHIFPVCFGGVLHAFAMTEHLMNCHTEEAVAPIVQPRGCPMISPREAVHILARSPRECILALLRKQLDVVGYGVS